MKTHRLYPILCLLLLSLLACTPTEEWRIQAVNDAGFPPYTFEYPATWELEAGNNFSTLVSHKDLLNAENLPDQLEPGQIMVGLTLNVQKTPEELLQYRIDSLTGFINFDEITSFELDGHPAASAVGSQPENQDQIFLLAVDLGQNNRALLSARIAAGELETWRETLYHIVNSISFH